MSSVPSPQSEPAREDPRLFSGADALVVVPTYNEIENLERLVHAIFAQGAYHILVVDDGSPDGTGDLAETLKTRYPDRVDVIHRAGKLGLGTAYIAGFKYALARDFQYVLEMDCDFQHDPATLPRFLVAIQHADLVIGSRRVPGGDEPGWSLFRRLISHGGTLYTRLVLGVPVNDLTSGFKCFHRRALETLDLDAIEATGFGFQVEVNYRCHRLGLKITEIPIVFTDRRAGHSKMSSRIFFEAMGMVWKLRFSSGRRASKPQARS